MVAGAPLIYKIAVNGMMQIQTKLCVSVQMLTFTV